MRTRERTGRETERASPFLNSKTIFSFFQFFVFFSHSRKQAAVAFFFLLLLLFFSSLSRPVA